MFKNIIMDPKEISWFSRTIMDNIVLYCIYFFFFKNDISLNFILRGSDKRSQDGNNDDHDDDVKATYIK